MSDLTLAASGITPYDPFSPLVKMAQLGQLNLQNQGLGITNQTSQMQLGLRQAQLASLAQQSPGGGLSGLANPGGNGTSAGQPGSLAQFVAGAPPGAGGPQGAPQTVGSQSLAALAQPQAGGTALPPSAGVKIAGFTMPMNWAAAAVMSNDPNKVYDDAYKVRMGRLHELATSAGSSQEWDQNVTQAYQEGWLSPQEYQSHLGNYGAMARIQQSLANPDSQLTYNAAISGQGLQSDANGNPTPSAAAAQAKGNIAGAEANARNQSELSYKPAIDDAENGPLAARARLTAGGTAAGKAPYDDPVFVTKKNADGSETTYTVPRATWAAQNGAGSSDGTVSGGAGRGADLLNPNAAIPAAAYANRVTGAENLGGNPGAKNPRSSATGNGQFIDSTWLSIVRQARPDLAGVSDDQLLAQRSNPALSNQATVAYAQQNAPVLQQAGVAVNAASLGIAHRLGPNGAVAVLNASPTTPLSSVLPPEVMAANPDLANQTVRSFTQGAISKYGLAPVSFGGNAATGGSGVQPAVAQARSAAAGASKPPADEQFPPDAPSNGSANGLLPPGALSANPPPPAPANGTSAISIPPPISNDLSSAPGVVTGQTPSAQQLAQMRAQGENDVSQMGEYRKSLVTQAQAAAQNNALVNQMSDESHNYTMGWGASSVGEAKAVLDGIAKNLGIPESDSFSQSLGSQQAFNKNAGALARTAAAQLGSRTGAQELAMIQKNLPSDGMSSQAFQRVTTQLGGINDYIIAKSAASANAIGNPSQFEANWNAHVSPTAFVVNRMPPDDLAQLHANLIKTPAGQASWANLKAQVQYAQDNGLFGAAR